MVRAGSASRDRPARQRARDITEGMDLVHGWSSHLVDKSCARAARCGALGIPGGVQRRRASVLRGAADSGAAERALSGLSRVATLDATDRGAPGGRSSAAEHVCRARRLSARNMRFRKKKLETS